jgi:DNA-binding beta-propeller fold protein YncE
MATLRTATPPGTGGHPRGRRTAILAPLGVVACLLSACSLFATPRPAPVDDPSMAPPGAVGYVVCPTAVTPVELATDTAEAPIELPISGSPVLGDFAIATSPDGQWAFVVTSDGVAPSSPASSTTVPPATAGTASTTSTAPVGPGAEPVQNVVIPIDLATQQAESPIPIPGVGGTHAIVVLPDGRTVLAASGNSIVPIDAATRQVGTPLDLGAGRTIFGMALDPTDTTLYALVAGAVIPVNTSNATAGAPIPTGLSVSSVYSPNGIVVTGNGTTVYVVGQGGTDFGGRVLPIAASTGTTGPATGFDRFGIADPAAVAVTTDGSSLLVADAANNWVNPVPLSSFSNPPDPVRLPERSTDAVTAGTQHPTDIVVGPGQTGAFLVDGFDAVIPYAPAPETFGEPIPVCSGASSMAVADSP